ncbi:MAG TPA: hypothetical protein VJ970_04935, partial [Flavobacteriaceae bacterium]|nr:hypothetical protein [Flavobacteriaceae bacterium]
HCCFLILKYHYGYQVDFEKDIIIELENYNTGCANYYRVNYNHNFAKIKPVENVLKISENEIEKLLKNEDDVAYWKRFFPPNSYLYSGFSLITLSNSTYNYSKLLVIENLLDFNIKKNKDLLQSFESLLQLKNINIGISTFKIAGQKWEYKPIFDYTSLIVNATEIEEGTLQYYKNDVASQLLDKKDSKTITINSQKESNNKLLINFLKQQNLGSLLLFPVVMKKTGYGFLIEITHPKSNVFNLWHIHTLYSLLASFKTSFEHQIDKHRYLIEAVIHKKCTSIHQSVKWKFNEVAENYIAQKKDKNKKAVFEEIAFSDVYPLYGQIDISDSSHNRNLATTKDLLLQLNTLKKLVKNVFKSKNRKLYKYLNRRIGRYLKTLEKGFKSNSELLIVRFLKTYAHPALGKVLIENETYKDEIVNYFNKLTSGASLYYYRKNYDNSIDAINKNLAAFIDEKQIEAQQIYPHYFERYKTDGIEHNIFIGDSLCENIKFTKDHLNELRLWQLETLCAMEVYFYKNKHLYATNLEVASLILVYDKYVNIRFRNDEKHFDVDGSYNVRYEIVKKRIDKALIKNTKERLTCPGKICIVYDRSETKKDYLNFIEKLQAKKILKNDVEHLAVEPLKGVAQLHALRVSIMYS